MATTSKLVLLGALALLGSNIIGCDKPTPNHEPRPHRATPALTPTPAPFETPRFVLEREVIERIAPGDRVFWRTKLPEAPQRQMVVLGQTVLVWGSDDELRRLDLDTGKPSGPNSPPRIVLSYQTRDQVLVQATTTGLVGLGAQAELWHRQDLLSESFAIAGPKNAPVIVTVERESGRARAVDLKTGADANFPLPAGRFDRVVLETDSGMLGWLFEEESTVYTNSETGEPF